MKEGWFEGFSGARQHAGDTSLYVRTGGTHGAPPLVLLHGFPQTGAMWQRVAARLAARHWLVIPDLRGYGRSDKPPGGADHAAYSKRVMAEEIVKLMRALGHERFAVAGHDRGARVAHRLALDHPEAVSRLVLLDIAPTLDMYQSTDMRFASAYYHWFFLIQPEPHPERMIGADPLHFLRWKLGGWGSLDHRFVEPQAMAEYEACIRAPEVVHAMCEDYRASAGIDLEHDRASRAAGVMIECPTQVLWGRRGVIHALFDPLPLWQAQCAQPVQGQALDCGHYMAEELPDEVAARIAAFVTSEA